MSLTRHSILNAAGSLLPVLAAVPAMAVVARILGVERFGLVSLAWTLVGYAGLLDLGLSRAVVRTVAVSRGNPEAQAQVLSSAVAVVAALGAMVCVALVFSSHFVAWRILGVSANYLEESASGIRVIAWTIPMLLVTSVLQSYWDGVEDFLEANVQRIIVGTAVPILTLGALLVIPTFTSAMIGVLSARAVGLFLALARRGHWKRIHLRAVHWFRIVELWRYGGWVAVSNVASPVLAYFDRFALAATQGATAVGPYSAAAEVAIRLLVVPVAVTRSLFPRLVANGDESGALVAQAYRLIGATSIPIGILIALLAKDVLGLWLGREFAAEGSAALQILMIGFLCSSFAQVPYTRLHARARTGIAALIQVGEVVPFLWATLVLSREFGILGAAAAWSGRNLVDWILLHCAERWTR